MVAGNWKLNGSRESGIDLANSVAKGLDGQADVLICPGFAHLADVSNAIKGSGLLLGAQNCSAFEAGAYTGEVAPGMLVEFGCTHVIVGHSERRQLFAESSELIASKTIAVQKAGLCPILCVGETLEQRESGQVDAVIGSQLDALLDVAGIEAFDNVIVAYEPVWAIGTGKTASSEQAQDVHAMIRAKIGELDSACSDKLRILYGGSVKPDNAATLFSQTDIDGGLIGGASLKADDFLAICHATA
ncbi:MAG: triose-phosphate isomerase [Granulosicoccaceae bacterium]